MKDLRELLEVSNQLNDIHTYIQSGNIIFESDNKNVQELAIEIYTYIYNRYGFEVPVQIYSKSDWDEFFKTTPF